MGPVSGIGSIGGQSLLVAFGGGQFQSPSIGAGRTKSFGLVVPRQNGYTLNLLRITFSENGSQQANL